MIRRGKERGHRGTVKALQLDHGTRDDRRSERDQAPHQAGTAERKHGRLADRRHRRERSAASVVGPAVRLREVQTADAPAPSARADGRLAIAFARAAASPRANRRRERKRGDSFRRKYQGPVRANSCRNASAMPTSTRFRSSRRSCINMSVGEAIANPKALDAARLTELTRSPVKSRSSPRRRSRSRRSSCAKA